MSFNQLEQTNRAMGFSSPLKGTDGKYGKFDAVIANKNKNVYKGMDAPVVSKMNDYDAYHATKGKVNRQLGKM